MEQMASWLTKRSSCVECGQTVAMKTKTSISQQKRQPIAVTTEECEELSADLNSD